MVATGSEDPLFRPIDADDFDINGPLAADYTNLPSWSFKGPGRSATVEACPAPSTVSPARWDFGACPAGLLPNQQTYEVCSSG